MNSIYSIFIIVWGYYSVICKCFLYLDKEASVGDRILYIIVYCYIGGTMVSFENVPYA